MYKHYYKAQDFVDYWCNILGIPHLDVFVEDNAFLDKLAGIKPEAGFMVVWNKNIDDRRFFVKALLHEVIHWKLYWQYKDDRYTNEKLVIKITNDLLKRNYPSYA